MDDNNFDPLFQRPALREDDVRSALAALAERTGILKIDRADWMIAGIIEGDASNLGSGPTITAWKNHDGLLTPDEKRARGINPRIKICRTLADTLTEKGLADVNEALSAVFMAPIFARSRNNPNQTVATVAGGTATAMKEYQDSQAQILLVVRDRRTCAVATAAHRTVYQVGEVPTLPLEGCDALSCRCTFITWSESAARRLGSISTEPTPPHAILAPEPAIPATLRPELAARLPEPAAPQGDGLFRRLKRWLS